MLKIFQINICPDLSTGNVMMGIAQCARNRGHLCVTASAPKGKCYISNHYVIGSSTERRISLLLGKIFGNEYCFSYFATLRLVEELKKFSPDIVHLHNLHAYYLNIPILFRYLKKSNITVVWTFHDCWPITGHCPHFLSAGCYKWHDGCEKCQQYRLYPYSLFDNSAHKYKVKKKIFRSLSNLTIVTPSNWLKTVVQQSFLGDRNIQVINNGIDLETFTPSLSEIADQIKQKYNVEYLVLGVASDWSNKKGLDIFVKLSDLLDSRFKIVLVGTNNVVDRILPDSIISIHRTANKTELVDLYSGADVFVNPTREDTYPTVNMEAIACGTPVVTFDAGGSPEIITSQTGIIVPVNDINELKKCIEKICVDKPFNSISISNESIRFNKEKLFLKYIHLYEQLFQNNDYST